MSPKCDRTTDRVQVSPELCTSSFGTSWCPSHCHCKDANLCDVTAFLMKVTPSCPTMTQYHPARGLNKPNIDPLEGHCPPSSKKTSHHHTNINDPSPPNTSLVDDIMSSIENQHPLTTEGETPGKQLAPEVERTPSSQAVSRAVRGFPNVSTVWVSAKVPICSSPRTVW